MGTADAETEVPFVSSQRDRRFSLSRDAVSSVEFMYIVFIRMAGGVSLISQFQLGTDFLLYC